MRAMVRNGNEYQLAKHRRYEASVTTQIQQLRFVLQVYGVENYGALNENESQTK